MKYVILADPQEDVLNLQVMGLSRFYGGRIVTCKSAAEVLDALKRNPSPELILINSSILVKDGKGLYDYYLEKDLAVPFIICSDPNDIEKFEKEFTVASAVIEKPLSVEALSYIVKSITMAPIKEPTHVPVLISILLVITQKNFDLYLRLSESNFVKIVEKGDTFTETDAMKLYTKGITHLYLDVNDSLDFLKSYEERLQNRKPPAQAQIEEQITLRIEGLETVEAISKRLGWNAEVIESARKSVEAAIGLLSKNVQISNVLKKRLANPSTPYSRHVGLLAYLTTALTSTLNIKGDGIQLKLALVSLMHDMGVDESYYEDIKTWNKKAADKSDKSAETISYRLHPLEVSRWAKGMDNLPPDVDQILLQHHERKDGSGFPRGLIASRIGILTSVFIIVEDLVDFIAEGENLETSFIDFITWGNENYDSGHFKKIFEEFKVMLK